MEPELNHDYRLIGETIPGLVATMTGTGQVEFANQQILNYFGRSLEELKGWTFSEAVHPDDLPRVIAAWTHAVDSGEAYDIEHRVRRADGVYCWFHVRGLPVRTLGGTIARWYVVLTDIDGRTRAEALLAGEKRFLEMVAGGESMPRILDALCELVENTAGGCHCSVVLVDPSGTRLEHVAAPSLPASFITTSRVILRSELAEHLPAVTGDRVQLQQVIMNLLRNASDAMSDVDDRPRQLVIRTERSGDGVCLTVQDAGVGLGSHGADKPFDAFFTTKPAGMGIGLSISRSIVESHHGRLWAAPNDGPGATFSFVIPCSVESVTGDRQLARVGRPWSSTPSP